MAVESKTRELLADIFIKALDEEKLPWTKDGIQTMFHLEIRIIRQDLNITASTK